jgi:hypothetical protein
VTVGIPSLKGMLAMAERAHGKHVLLGERLTVEGMPPRKGLRSAGGIMV